jgi:hypothetical protein
VISAKKKPSGKASALNDHSTELQTPKLLDMEENTEGQLDVFQEQGEPEDPQQHSSSKKTAEE